MHAQQLSQTLLASWRQRDRSAPWGLWLVVALMLLPTLAALVWLEGPARWMLPTIILVLAIQIVWMVVCANLQLQNDPAAARFVPGHVRALQGAALLGWSLCTVVTAGLLWWALPPIMMWQSMLLASAAAATFALWATRVWWLWLVACLYAPLGGVFWRALEPAALAAHALWLANTAQLLVLGLLGLAAASVLVFGHGDARHRRAYERLRRWQSVQRMFQEGRQVTPVQTFSSLERFARPFNAVIDGWRRHVVAQADNQRLSSVLARAELVLNLNQHWTYQLLTAVSVVLGVALSLAVVMAWTGVSAALLLEHGAFGISIGLASMAVNPTLARPMLWQTRREQALLRLLPGMPQGAGLNRAVAWIGLRHALVAAAVVTLLLLPLAWATHRPALLWLPVAAVPWGVWTTTRAPARMRPPTGLTMVLPVFAFYLSAGLGYLASERLGLPMLPLVAAVLACSAAAGVIRWRRLDAQPVALPAGRLS